MTMDIGMEGMSPTTMGAPLKWPQLIKQMKFWKKAKVSKWDRELTTLT